MKVCDECVKAKKTPKETKATVTLCVTFSDDSYVGGEPWLHKNKLDLCPEHATEFLKGISRVAGTPEKFLGSVRSWIGEKLSPNESGAYNGYFNVIEKELLDKKAEQP